jgi:hypothetical protein
MRWPIPRAGQAVTHQVHELLVGRRVELVFNPFDLTGIEVRDHRAPPQPVVDQ